MKFDFYSLISSVLHRAGGNRRVCFPLISQAGSLGEGLSELEGAWARGAASDEKMLRGSPRCQVAVRRMGAGTD